MSCDLLFKVFGEIGYVEGGGGSCGDVSYPELVVFRYFLGRQDFVEVVFRAVGWFGGHLGGGPFGLGRLRLEAGGDEDGGLVFEQGVGNGALHI